MRKTKDQKDLLEILALTQAASDAAYSLLSRRLDARRNIDSFIRLRDAFNMLKGACEALQESENKATDSKATSQTSVMDEILIRCGRMKVIDESDEIADSATPGPVLPFPEKK